MQKVLTDSKAKKPNFYLPLIILFILGDILCDNYVLQSFNQQSAGLEFFLFVGLLVLQMFSSPLQAGFSDFYCRKKSLIISLVFSFFSLILVFAYNEKIFVYFPTLIAILLLKGTLGNTIPLSWAALADTQKKNFRFSLALSTGAYALGYLIMSVFKKYLTSSESNIAAIIMYVVLIVLCIGVFRDLRDKTIHEREALVKKTGFFKLSRNEIFLLIQQLRDKSLREGLKAYILWEISIYSILILLVDFENKYPDRAIVMMCGYLVGVGIMKLCQNIQDSTMIRVGYWISILFFSIFFILLPFAHSIQFLFPFCFFFYSMCNAFLSSTILAILSKEKKTHEQGKVFGFIESADIIGFLFASIVIMIFNHYEVDFVYIVAFSFITFILSWWPYSKHEKLKAAES